MNAKKIAIAIGLAIALAANVNFDSILKPTRANAKQMEEFDVSGDRAKEPVTVITVYNTTLKTNQTMAIEEYIKGVVSSEMSPDSPIEALKAQAIASRTYAMYRVMNNITISDAGAHVDDTVNCQAFKSIDARYESWSLDKRDQYLQAINTAVEDTKGICLAYDGNILSNAHFFASTGKKTENCNDVFVRDIPYLKSVDSNETTSYSQEIKLTHWGFTKAIKEKYPNLKFTSSDIKDKFKILSYNKSGSVKEIEIAGQVLKSTEFRTVMGLQSTELNITFTDKEVIIKTVGYGHGVGMSQNGAKDMARTGKSYEEILKHYYTGIYFKTVE